MYKRLSAVMFPIVTLLFIGTALWGYQEFQQKNALMVQAENQYQRAFHDLTFHMDKLQDQLGQTLAVHSTSQGMHRKGLANVWKTTSEAQSDISQLPLSTLPFEQTEEFLSRISSYAYQASVRDMTKQPLTNEEMNTLKTLYANSKQISADLQDVQNKVLANGLRWMDVQSAMSNKSTSGNTAITDGFKSLDGKVSEYPEIDWGTSVASLFSKRTLTMLEGPEVSEDEIKKKAAKLMKPHEMKEITIRKNGNSPDHMTYTARAEHKNGDGEISIDFTKQGVVLSFMDTRSIGKKQVSIDEAADNAASFIKRHGFENMNKVRSQSYDGLETFTYVPVKEDVLLYPMKVLVRVALDTGDIVGVQAADYIYGASDMKSVSIKPKLTKEQALARVNPNMKVSYDRLVVIKNEVSQPVLCYEIGGTTDDQNYRIYINAETGNEEIVESVSKT
ncbi:germination protein YpeB [Paenibacillus marinisediminis]